MNVHVQWGHPDCDWLLMMSGCQHDALLILKRGGHDDDVHVISSITY